MSFAVYYSRLEGLVRARLGDGDETTISTAEIASGLDASMEDAVRIYEAYNRYSGRQFEFEKRSAPFENRNYHRLVIHRTAASTREPFSGKKQRLHEH